MGRISVSQLIEQKQHYSSFAQQAYDQVSFLYQELNAKFCRVYPYYKKFDLYEITNVDFWFGDIACDYRGKNYELSEGLFELNKQLRDIDVFDLEMYPLVRIYNFLSKLCREVYGYPWDVIDNLDLSVNSVLGKIKTITNFVIKACISSHSWNDRLSESIQRFYVFLDFALHTDSEKHDDLRACWRQFLTNQSHLYGLISFYNKKIDYIDQQLERLQQ